MREGEGGEKRSTIPLIVLVGREEWEENMYKNLIVPFFFLSVSYSLP